MKRENNSNKFRNALLGFATGSVLFAGLYFPKNESSLNQQVTEDNQSYESKSSNPTESTVQNQDLRTATKPKSLDDFQAYADYTGIFEGRRTRVYDPNPKDGKPEPTIGIGHYMDRGNSKETFARVLPEVNYSLVYSGKESLTHNQVDRLFSEDVKTYIRDTKKLVPKFDEFPLDVKKVLVDMNYRGDLRGSLKFRKLFNSGKINEAANELIKRKDYENAIRNCMSGVKRRLDSHREILINYSKNN